MAALILLGQAASRRQWVTQRARVLLIAGISLAGLQAEHNIRDAQRKTVEPCAN